MTLLIIGGVLAFAMGPSLFSIDIIGHTPPVAGDGMDVIWTTTVTNTGSKDIADLKLLANFGFMDFEATTPLPVDAMGSGLVGFGPLKAGDSLKIDSKLSAKQTGNANGYITVVDAREPCTIHLKTAIR